MRPFKAFNQLRPLYTSRFGPLCSLSLFCPSFFFSHSPRFSTLDHKTFMEVVKAVARQGSVSCESIAIRADQKSYTYSQLMQSAWRISRLLCNGDQKTVDGTRGNDYLAGARIGIVAKPSAEFVAGILGTWFSGGVAVPLALSYPEAELLHVMNDSDVSMILSTEEHSEFMQNVAAKSAAQFSLIPPVHSKSETGEIDAGKSLEGVDNSNRIQGEDPALIIYTSGTTGKPKGVVHTHRGILAQAQILTDAWKYTSADQFLHCLPLHHVHGLFNALLAPLYAGSTVEFIPKFSVRAIWQRWRESYPKDGTNADDAIIVFTGVPTMYTRLIQGYEAMDPELQEASASAASKLCLMVISLQHLSQEILTKIQYPRLLCVERGNM